MSDLPEFDLDDVRHLVHDPAKRQSGENLAKETEDHKAFRLLPCQAPAHEIEAGLRVQLTHGGSVGAPYVVCLNLEVGEGVGPGTIGEEKVPIGLVGVGPLGFGMNPDDAPEYGP
jgi:hypothetical protein